MFHSEVCFPFLGKEGSKYVQESLSLDLISFFRFSKIPEW